MQKIVLTQEKETLLIPLFGKAKEMKKDSPILVDRKAVEILNQIEYDFSSLKIPEKTNILMSLRAKLIDNFVSKYLSKSQDSAAIHLGCGLDSRYDRIGNTYVDWYDIDFPEVIDIRKLFFPVTARYHLIPSSVTDDSLFEKLPVGKEQNIVIAEGLFMYLKEDEIKKLVTRLKDKLGNYTLIFDAFSTYTAKKVRNHPSIKKTGALIQWGIDNPNELANWNIDIELINEQYFTSNDEIKNLGFGTKTMFKIANLFRFVRNAHRLLVYKVG